MTEQPSVDSARTGEPSSEPSDTQGPDRAEILALLDKEIEEAHATRARSGWSLQAMLAAMAALAWIVLDQADREHPNLASACAFALACSCALDALVALWELVVNVDEPREARFSRFGRFAFRPSFQISVSLRYIVLGVTAMLVFPDGHDGARWTAIGVFGVGGALGFLFSLRMPRLLARTPPLATRPHRPFVSRIAVATAALLLAAAVALLSAVEWTTPSGNVGVIKMGGSFALFLFLGSRLVRVREDAKSADLLTDLRRELALHLCDPATAAGAAEAIIMGVRTAEVLRPLVTRALDACGGARGRARSARALLEELRVMPSPSPGVREATDDRCRQLVDEIGQLVAISLSELNRIRAARSAMSVTAPSAREDAAPIITLVQVAIDDVQEELVALQTEIARHVVESPASPAPAAPRL